MVAFLSFPWWFGWALLTVVFGLPLWALLNIPLFWGRNWVTAIAWFGMGLNAVMLLLVGLSDRAEGSFLLLAFLVAVFFLIGGYLLRPPSGGAGLN